MNTDTLLVAAVIATVASWVVILILMRNAKPPRDPQPPTGRMLP